jgi:hypothetical protein
MVVFLVTIPAGENAKMKSVKDCINEKIVPNYDVCVIIVAKFY